jgi:DNA-binding transcriptional LysR family regulator
MDRLDAMAMFVAAVDEGSLAAAARKLGRSAPSVTRAIALLEAWSGERLLHRSSRRIRLTEAGDKRLASYRLVLAELAAADAQPAAVAGSLVLTTPVQFGRFAVMPVLESFLEQHPGVSARMLLLDRVVSLVEEGVDVAVRLAALPDSALSAVRVGEVRRMVCAAPAYLEAAGAPDRPDDLASHACIALSDVSDLELWPFETQDAPRRRVRSVQVRARLTVNSAAATLDAALRGQGVGRFMAYQVAELIAQGRLTPLLQDFEPPPVPVHLVFHPTGRRGGAVRAFVDHATPRLRRRLAEVAAALNPSSTPSS